MEQNREGLTNFIRSLAIDDVQEDKFLMDLHYGFVGKNLEDMITTDDEEEEEIERKKKIKASLDPNFIPTQEQIDALKDTIYNVLNDGVPYGYAQMIKYLLFCIREYGNEDPKIEKLWERTEKEEPRQFIEWLSYEEIDTLVDNSLKVIDELYAGLQKN